MRKKLITIITYITIITFIGFLVVLSIDRFRASKVSEAVPKEKETNLIIQYNDKDVDDEEAVESRENDNHSESYVLPNAIKNQYIKVKPL